MDDICMAFAEVVDAKSPFTYRHSTGVADAAVAMARTLGLVEEPVTMIRWAALLHDIGKLSVPNSILEKPAKLEPEEWAVVKRHPYYSYEVLRRIPGFNQLSEVAASHHERLDGKGYFRSYGAQQLDLPSRILAVADVYDALAAKRPYRDALPLETVLGIMKKESPHALDAGCLEALGTATEGSAQPPFPAKFSPGWPSRRKVLA
jgi:putative nucleotidyltransferase with HDIG domain